MTRSLVQRRPWRATAARQAPGQQLLAGACWTTVGAVVSRAAAFAASLVVARTLGRVRFGELGVLEGSMGMFAVLSNLGLSLTSIKFIAKYRTSDPRKTGRILTLCCVFAAVSGLVIGGATFLAADWLATRTLGAPHLAFDLRLASAMLALSSVNGSLNGALLGFNAFKQVAHLNFLLGAASFPILTTGAVLGGLHGVVCGMVVVQATSTLLHLIQVRRAASACGVPLVWRGWWRERAVLHSFSLPALLNASLRSPVHWLCVALLVNQTGGYSQMGLLHAVNPWFLLVLFLPGQLSNVYYPMVEDAWTRGDYRTLRQTLRQATQATIAVCALIAVVAIIGASAILDWYGPEYRDAAWVLRITVATGVIAAAQQPLGALMISACNMWLVVLCSAGWAVVCLAASYLLLDFGAVGLASSRLLAYAVYAALVIGVGMRSLRSLRTIEPIRNVDTSPQARTISAGAATRWPNVEDQAA